MLTEGGYGGLRGITVLKGKKNHHFEGNLVVFIGHTREYFARTSPNSKNFLMPFIDAGHRYQEPNGGLMFKANIANIGVAIGIGWAL